jgi:hypothetical protein
MIALAKAASDKTSHPAWHANFLAMLPRIQLQAQLAFRAVRLELRKELVAEVVANSYTAYARLVERGKEGLAFPTPLAQFAIRQIHSGRRVGTRLNNRDVASPQVRAAKGIALQRLDQFDEVRGHWREILVEDRKAGPAETAAARIDLAAWFQSLTGRKRKIAKTLAQGEATQTVARKFGLSAARISQLREEFRQSWEAFQGEAIA